MGRNKTCLYTFQCLAFAFILLFLPYLSYSSGLVYTIQTGSFLTMADAQRAFDGTIEKLHENELYNLRIEKIGKYYSVRLGAFNDYTSAATGLSSISQALQDAAILKAYVKEERIVTSYSGSLPDNEEYSVPGTTAEEMGSVKNKKPDRNVREESMKEALLKKVSLSTVVDDVFLEEGEEPSDEGIMAVTIPSADITLSFIQTGRIATVNVKEGDVVKANQVLVQQDSAAEREQLSMIREESKNTTQIEAKEASLAQKREYLKTLEWAAERGAATDAEIEDAKLEVRIAEFSLKTADVIARIVVTLNLLSFSLGSKPGSWLVK